MDNRSLQAVIDRWSVGETDWSHRDVTTLLAEVNRLRGVLQEIADVHVLPGALTYCREKAIDALTPGLAHSASGEPDGK